MNIEEALLVVDTALENIFLSDVQELVLRQSWEGKTYPEIAESYGYEANYIKNVGYKLWSLLSQAFAETITKSNFRSVIRRQSVMQAKRAHSTFTGNSINHANFIDNSRASAAVNNSENTHQNTKSIEVESSPKYIADNTPILEHHLVAINFVNPYIEYPLLVLFKPDENQQELNIQFQVKLASMK